ncbi:MAG: class III poly(R)-hydroxyalkanoic acid synthase subunit PhaC [Gammaproteobacteria bacterium]|nr:class III poly(R)-hydroxyalkanoic acid synthase subunit PhaC [Gammaproteobacteria bacterium]
MSPLKITPDKMLQEMYEFNKKLGEGVKNLSQIGEIDVGISPKEAVHQEDKMVLYHYKPATEKLNSTPLLIVYALVNRPYMADLQDGRSLIQGLRKAGQDVYLIDWGYPDGSDRCLTLDDYLNGYVDRCVNFICKKHGIDRINLLGICQGGTFSLCYSAMHPERVRNLVTMVTPVDFHTPDNLLSHWSRKLDVDLMVDTMGNIPGEMLNWTFLSMKPFRLTGQKYIDMVNMLGDTKAAKNFMRMEKWIFDSPDQAGETFREFTKGFFQQNGLVKGEINIGGYQVNLKNITIPVLNVYATQDHLVPPDASKALKGKTGTKDYKEIDFRGGHIGIYVSGRAQKEIPPAIGKWLDERSE